MTRTTLKLDAHILRALKIRAAEEGVSMQDLANRLLRRAMATEERPPYALTLTGWAASPQPGVDLLDRDSLFDLMNGG